MPVAVEVQSSVEICDGPQIASVPKRILRFVPAWRSLREFKSLSDLTDKHFCPGVDPASRLDQFHERGKSIRPLVLLFAVGKSGQAPEVPPVGGTRIGAKFLVMALPPLG